MQSKQIRVRKLRLRKPEKKPNKATGFLIAGASLALLWGLAFLKGRSDK